MGNAISSGTKYCTSFVIGKAKYILQLEDNIEALESDVQLLEARRLDLENKIKLDERKGLQRLHEVVVWFLRVEAIQSQARDLLDAKTVEVERLSMCGYCSNDFILTYRYGKRVSESLEKVKGYLSSKTFEVVTWEGLPPDMEEGTSQSTTSMPSDIEEDLSQSTTGVPLSDIEEDLSLSTTGVPPSDIEEDLSQSTTGVPPSDIEEDLSQSTIGVPPSDIEEDLSLSTTGVPPSDIEEDLSQSTIGVLPSDIEEDLSLSTTGVPPSDIEEDLSLSTTGVPHSDIEEDLSQSTIGVPPSDIEEDLSLSTTGVPPSDIEEDLSQSTTGVPPSDIEEDLSQSTTGVPPSDIEEDLSQSTTGVPPSDIEEGLSLSSTGVPPSDIEEDLSQSTTGVPPSDIEEDLSLSTTGVPLSDIEEDLSQSITGVPPSNIKEDPYFVGIRLSPYIGNRGRQTSLHSQFTTSLPSSDIKEDPSQSTTVFGIEKDLSVSTTGVSFDIEVDPSHSTICRPSSVEEDPSESTTDLSLDMEEEPIENIIGLENMLEATWTRLMEDNVGILGLYGMGGIGKTTLLLQIEEKFLEKRDEFDEVILVEVSQDLQIGRIQNEIGNQLGLYDSEWKQKIKEEKASDINKVLLTRKRFVILLDDIWEKVELEEIGIPLPSTQNRSKVVYTTCSRKVCGSMGPDDMEVKCLSSENAWKVFQFRVGANTLESDPEISKLAKIVCDKCKGIPLALNIIGEIMAREMTVHKWQHAVEVLNSNSAECTTELEDMFLKILSYDLLQDEGLRQCFQYCALFPEDSMIYKDDLVKYWICEGLVDGGGKKEEAVNHGYAIIHILVEAGLLIDLEDMNKVQMTEVIHQMALRSASNFGAEKENFVVKIDAALHQMPEIENPNAVRRMSLMNNQIQTISVILDCPNLTTLFLQKNKLVSISGDSFLSMPKLVVLDLSFNKHLNKLPEEVSKLMNLRYLDLSGTGLHELPMGLSELIQLRHLDLNRMEKLKSISVISSLLNLETLNVFCSAPLSLASIKDIELLKNLIFLSVTITELSILECFLSISRLASCTQDLIILWGCEAKDLSLAATAAESSHPRDRRWFNLTFNG